MSNSSKITAAKRVQYGALPYRLTAGSRPQFMLITSRETRRWVIPKGNPSSGMVAHTAAAIEAEEEAGVQGLVCPTPLGTYRYRKRQKNGASLMFDVDTSDDLAVVAAAIEERRAVAPRTRGALRQLDRAGARLNAPAGAQT